MQELENDAGIQQNFEKTFFDIDPHSFYAEQ